MIYDDITLYTEAMKIAKEKGTINIGSLRRKLRCSVQESISFIEKMEKEGVIGPYDPKYENHVVG